MLPGHVGAMAQPTQPLPSKESGLFRQVVKFYESKQYKKAIKAADQILKKFPEHGETLAMKVCSSRLTLGAAAVLLATLLDGSIAENIVQCLSRAQHLQ